MGASQSILTSPNPPVISPPMPVSRLPLGHPAIASLSPELKPLVALTRSSPAGGAAQKTCLHARPAVAAARFERVPPQVLDRHRRA